MEFEEVLTVHVQLEKTTELKSDDGDSVIMISFKGNATGKYFEGEILEGGIDTQIIGKLGDRHTLSARYMLEGKDYTGETCKMYIENNGNANSKLEDALFITSPKIITNSKALSYWNDLVLVGKGLPTETGLDIKIYKAI
ncbi:DUF3237 family protein [Litchfieldia salsa]|uniref:DUF3237 domain-containing protein n=1 Tax=Litchfieldia salsa TaxID=930152 RepID=A0A1H0WM34_9BACI|nr:DUF3237 family protein [Litchfieldia salsa]SDP91631.1 Protein of unknown function [Litchfieldia salsa]